MSLAHPGHSGPNKPPVTGEGLGLGPGPVRGMPESAEPQDDTTALSTGRQPSSDMPISPAEQAPGQPTPEDTTDIHITASPGASSGLREALTRKSVVLPVGLALAAAGVFAGIRLSGGETEGSRPATSTGTPQEPTATQSPPPTPNTTSPTDMPIMGEVPISRNSGSQTKEPGSHPDAPRSVQELIPNPTRMPESVVELGTFANLTVGQQEWMKDVNNMTPEEFLGLPLEDQRAFGWQIAQNLVYVVERIRAEGGAKAIRFHPKARTAQEKTDNRMLLEMASYWTWEDRGPSATPVFNPIASLALEALIKEGRTPQEILAFWTENYGKYMGEDGFNERTTPQKMKKLEREVTSSYPDPRSDGTVVETITPNSGEQQGVVLSRGVDILSILNPDSGAKRKVVATFYPITRVLKPDEL